MHSHGNLAHDWPLANVIVAAPPAECLQRRHDLVTVRKGKIHGSNTDCTLLNNFLLSLIGLTVTAIAKRYTQLEFGTNMASTAEAIYYHRGTCTIALAPIPIQLYVAGYSSQR